MMHPDDNRRGPFVQPAFVICVAVLALAATGMSLLTRAFGLFLKKEPLPLKKPLDAMDEDRLAPYKVVARHTIDNERVVESLGTEDYIQWVIEDPREPVGSAARKVLLFITYYGTPDRVPHVPEECYTGGGYDRLAQARVAFKIGGGNQNGSVPGRFLLFQSPHGGVNSMGGQFPVLYLFRINREYAGNRDDARIALNRAAFRRHSYFSKIEMAFNQGSAVPTKDEAVAACERLLSVLLPVLEQEQWPDSE
ncbi:MAG TPA: exosortase-associated EpsI family protein [Sedimentisphaerales bacterium]|nr:exosortase-associated EpsI family protein [Sedimentisphaerales bacterium]HNU28463.1 exosortase-associated EpsI family protein [Sedimentisphaerales bacterium]